MFGEHAEPVRSEEAAPETRNALPFSLVIWLTASATPEFGVSTITSTLSVSYHWRAIAEPTSGLFWWSAEMTSTLTPRFSMPESSTAILAAATEPAPARSVYRLDISVKTPILTTPSETCACATPAAQVAATARPTRLRLNAFMPSPSLSCSRAEAPRGFEFPVVAARRRGNRAVSPCSPRGRRYESCRRRGHGPLHSADRRPSRQSGNSARPAGS